MQLPFSSFIYPGSQVVGSSFDGVVVVGLLLLLVFVFVFVFVLVLVLLFVVVVLLTDDFVTEWTLLLVSLYEASNV